MIFVVRDMQKIVAQVSPHTSFARVRQCSTAEDDFGAVRAHGLLSPGTYSISHVYMCSVVWKVGNGANQVDMQPTRPRSNRPVTKITECDRRSIEGYHFAARARCLARTTEYSLFRDFATHLPVADAALALQPTAFLDIASG